MDEEQKVLASSAYDGTNIFVHVFSALAKPSSLVLDRLHGWVDGGWVDGLGGWVDGMGGWVNGGWIDWVSG